VNTINIKYIKNKVHYNPGLLWYITFPILTHQSDGNLKNLLQRPFSLADFLMMFLRVVNVAKLKCPFLL